MRISMVAVALTISACGSRAKGTSSPTGGDDDAPVLKKQAIVSFGMQPASGRTKVWVVITDETGAATSFPLEDVPATGCAPAAGGDLDAIGSLRCEAPQLRVIVVARQGEFIILDQHIDTATGEPSEFEEQKRVAIPEGASVSFQP
jgi:hypothetical protein